MAEVRIDHVGLKRRRRASEASSKSVKRGQQKLNYYQGEGVHKDTLCDDDPGTEIEIRLLELDECEEVHALVLGLLEQCVDPPVIMVHPPKRP